MKLLIRKTPKGNAAETWLSQTPKYVFARLRDRKTTNVGYNVISGGMMIKKTMKE
jgi:hypothetical protein